MIKNKNFNIVNIVSTNRDFNYENYKNFLIINKQKLKISDVNMKEYLNIHDDIFKIIY